MTVVIVREFCHERSKTVGAEPWLYFVPFQRDVETALERLRRQEFAAGRYRGSELRPQSMEEAFENMEADGTASILDIMMVADEPNFCAVAPLAGETLNGIYGTDQPTRAMVEGRQDFYEDIERGQGVYFTVYKDGQPHELCFAGYSFD